MALKLGTLTPTALYLGTTAASAAYLGATQVYSTGVADAYAIGGASPELVAAFTLASDGTTAGEYFRKASSETTFGDLFTFSRSGLATQFDSTGTLVWAPHNLMDGSHNFDNETYWFSSNLTEAAATTNGPDGSTKMWALTDADGSNYGGLLDVGSVGFPSTATAHVCEFWLTKDEDETRFPCIAVDGTNDFYLHVNTKTGAHVFEYNTASATAVVTEAVTGLWRVRVTFQARGGTNIVLYPARGTVIGTPSTAATGTAEFGFLAFYRADLPMADNPDQPTGLEKYVPTTTAAVYGPRRNAYYYNAAWVKGGLQRESAAATNLQTYSNDFSNAAWSKSLAAVTQNASGPAGANTAWTFSDDGLGGTGAITLLEVHTVATSTTYTFSVFAKADQLSWLCISPTGFTTPNNPRAFFDLANGVLGSYGEPGAYTNMAGVIPRIEDYGSGWYRCSITFTTDAADTVGAVNMYLADADLDIGVDRDGTSSILIYGAQFEAGSVPSSYTPTTGSTVTRAAETLSIAAANLPFNATGISAHVKGYAQSRVDTGSDFSVQLARWGGTSSTDFVYVRARDGGSGFGTLQGYGESGNTSFNTTGSLAVDYLQSQTPFNVAWRLKDTGSTLEFNAALNGTAGVQVTPSLSMPNIELLDFYPYSEAGGMPSAFVSEIRIWGSDIGDSGIEEVTTVPAFDPASLFASGEEGLSVWAADATSYTDTARTTLATVAQQVAGITDGSGNGNHLSQVTTAARPILRQTGGGLRYWEFDTVDDWIGVTASVLGTGMTAYTMLVAFELRSESNVDGVAGFTDDSFSTGDNFGILRNRSGTGIEFISWLPSGTNEFSPAAQASSTSTPYLALITSTDGAQSARLNGSEYATGTVAHAASTPAEFTLGAYSRGGATAGEVNIYGALLINRVLTAEEIANLEAHAAALSGVTL